MAEEESTAQEETQTEKQVENEEDAELKSVSSSMVSEMAWDEGTLEIIFNNGHEESYPIDEATWQLLKNSPSIGQAMWSYVLR